MAASNMGTAAQRVRVVEALRGGPQTTYSLRARGVSHPAMRIKELVALGHAIASSRVTAIDSDGFSHNGVAMYELAECRQPGLFDQWGTE
ncbi:helix-turn-helix domain-containing protein [Paraburkholderia sp. RL17-381-BIF-C]|uniref:helix-turn-helix domain-containing protein n=1 Tax=Paraburkholderia sp. RL17-381-BIF-C TaxID=3031635 RepID=UPI0038B7C1E1